MQLVMRLQSEQLDQLLRFATRELALIDRLAIDQDAEGTKQVNLQSCWRRGLLAHGSVLDSY